MVAGALTTKISVYEPEADLTEFPSDSLPFVPGRTYECGVEIDLFEFEMIHWPADIRRDHFEQVKLHAAHWVHGLLTSEAIVKKPYKPMTRAENYRARREGRSCWAMPEGDW